MDPLATRESLAGAVPAERLLARRVSPRALIALLAAVLVGAVLVACCLGSFPVAASDVPRIILAGVGLEPIKSVPQEAYAVVWSIRLPRIVLALAVGAGLGAAGASMQAIFRNPLADPSLIGVSGGAALAAAAVLAAGARLAPSLLQTFGVSALPLAAFAGGLVVSLAVYRLATRAGYTSIATLLLAGVAMNAIAEAGIGVFTYVASDSALRGLAFWQLGSLAGATWSQLSVAVPAILLAAIYLLTQARCYDALALGEAEAQHLGIDVERLKVLTLCACALATGAAVALSGMVFFVGLVAPHLVRLACGPGHRTVLPGAALCGAIVLVAADTLARTVVAPAELPLGVFTALVGAPFFIALLLRRREAWHL
jgi:iron complex transport system permease protein